MATVKHWTRILWNLALLLSVAFVLNSSGAGTAKASQEEQLKIEGAKKEGKLTFYAVISVPDAQKLLIPFNKKYPFIKTNLFRSSSAGLVTRALTEANAKRYVSDVFLSDSIDTHHIQNAGLVSKYLSPESKVYPKEVKDPDGFWTAAVIITRVLAYNTHLVATQDVPKKYEDLLNPKWKGKLGMPADEIDWFAGQLKIMGREKGLEFFRKLSQQDLQIRRGKTLITQLLAAGEYSIAVMSSGQTVQNMKNQGAPVEWVGIEPVISTFQMATLMAHAPNPNAGKLFIDFILSKEGQEIIRSMSKIPLRPDVPPNPPRLLQGFKLLQVEPAWSGKEYYQLYRDIFAGK